jgi:hypothetical protein
MDTQITAVITGATLGLLIRLFIMLLGMKKQTGKLAAINAKLDLLLGQAGVQFDPIGSVCREAVDALKRGDKIEAIKLYRNATGASLVEAKQTIELAQS